MHCNSKERQKACARIGRVIGLAHGIQRTRAMHARVRGASVKPASRLRFFEPNTTWASDVLYLLSPSTTVTIKQPHTLCSTLPHLTLPSPADPRLKLTPSYPVPSFLIRYSPPTPIGTTGEEAGGIGSDCSSKTTATLLCTFTKDWGQAMHDCF
jgi:hypothetical protein